MTFPTRPLRKADLQRLLAQMMQSVVPSAELQAARQWAMAASLLDEQGLTAEGRLVATKDPYLESTVTDWLIHFNLSSIHDVWNYFVYEFLPIHSTFRESELTSSVVDTFSEASSDTLKRSVQSLLKTYTDLHAIAKHKFLVQENGAYSAGSSDLSNPYTTGYLLAKVWERDFGEKSAVLSKQLMDAKMSLANALGIGKTQLRKQLDILAESEIIEKRLIKLHLAGTKLRLIEENEHHYQVRRCWQTPIELLEKAFENDRKTPNRPLIQSLGSLLDDGDDTPDFSQFLEWASGLMLGGGSNTIRNLAS